jgi:hypothetical protein
MSAKNKCFILLYEAWNSMIYGISHKRTFNTTLVYYKYLNHTTRQSATERAVAMQRFAHAR